MLKNKNCAQSIYIQIYMKNITTCSRQCRKTVLLGCIYKWQQDTSHILSDIDCSNRVYQSFVANFQIYFLLCWNYA